MFGFRVGLASQDDRRHTFQEEGWSFVTKQKLSQRELIALEHIIWAELLSSFPKQNVLLMQ